MECVLKSTAGQGAVQGTTPCSELREIAAYYHMVGFVFASVKSPPYKYKV